MAKKPPPSQKPTENKSLKPSKIPDFRNEETKDKWYSLKTAAKSLNTSKKKIIELANNEKTFLYIMTPSGFKPRLEKDDLDIFLKRPKISVKFPELRETYKNYLSEVETSCIETCENLNEFEVNIFDEELKVIKTTHRRYLYDSKDYDITTDLFRIQKHDLDSLNEQLDSSSSTKGNVKDRKQESFGSIVEWQRENIENFPSKKEPNEPVAKIAKSKEKQQGDEESLSEKTESNNCIFRKDGERWYIKFKDEELKPENLDGLEYIHYLIQNNNNKPITPKNLYLAVKGAKMPNNDEDDFLKTYSVQAKEIGKAQHGELKEHHSNSEMLQFENKLIKMNKNEIKKIVAILKEDKETLINKKSELEEGGVFSESEDIKKEIKDVQQKIDLVTRKEHNPEYKRFYDLVSKAMQKAKEKIKKLSIEDNHNSSLTWNHFKNSITLKDQHYSYNPTTPIDWEL